MPERAFLIFWIFLLYFSQFSFPGGVWTEFGTKIFLYLSLPLSTRFRQKYCWNKLFSFFEFFCFLFWNFLARVECERNLGLKFFSRFLGPSPPVLAKNNAGKRFLNFFFFFFQNFHARVNFEPNSGLIFFFSLFRPISSRFG